MEQLYHHISDSGLIEQSVPAVTKYIWIVRLRRGVNCFNCAPHFIYLLYLQR